MRQTPLFRRDSSCVAAAGVCAAAAPLLGLLALLGWALNADALKGGWPGLVAMNPATAVAFILSGAALGLLSFDAEDARRSGAGLAARACAAAVAVVAGLKFASYLGARWDFGVDRRLFTASVDRLFQGRPNRMAPNTALDFLLYAGALLLLDAETPWGRVPAQLLAVLVAWTGLLAMIGYAYGVTTLYGIASFIPMALNTAGAFLLLALGALCARPADGLMAAIASDSAAGTTARRLLLAGVACPVLAGWLALKGLEAGLCGADFALSAFAAAVILIFAVLVHWSARLLYAAEGRLVEANEGLRAAHEALGVRVRERTEKLAATEATLRQSENRYQDLVELSPEAIFLQTEGRFAYVNAALLRLLGCSSPDQLLGREILDFVHPDSRAQVSARLRTVLQDGEGVPLLEEKYVTVDGTPVDVEVIGSPFVVDGKPGAQVFLRDISERKKLQRELLQSQKMEAIGRLAGGVAHDFNNILTAIEGFSSFVLNSLEPGDARRDDVEEILKASGRAAALTRQLLAFSRRQVFQVKVLDPNAVVTGLRGMLKRLIGDDVELEVALTPGIGRVKADPGQLEQVIVNLAVNSRDALPVGGKITIETADAELDEDYAREHPEVAPGPYVMLAVSDTGRGMAPEVLARVFEPFFTTKERGKGTGLGLSTVHGIVRQSGGSVFVYSELERGTTFKVYLPRVQEVLDGPAPARAVLPLGGTESILVVDDDELVRKVVARVLGAAGYAVLAADSPEDALRLAADPAVRIHLLLTDVVMPRMAGDELARRLAELRPEVKVLFMSGYADHAVARHGILESGAAFLQKPLSADPLLRKVREILAGSPAA